MMVDTARMPVLFKPMMVHLVIPAPNAPLAHAKLDAARWTIQVAASVTILASAAILRVRCWPVEAQMKLLCQYGNKIGCTDLSVASLLL
jgi:hypothetical protein